MGAQGTASVNGGAIGAQSNEATIAITGQATIAAFPTSIAEAWLFPSDTAEHSADEHRGEIENLEVWADTIVAATGFTIHVKCRNGVLYGNWSVAWVWN